jgi:hypothetical protein
MEIGDRNMKWKLFIEIGRKEKRKKR